MAAAHCAAVRCAGRSAGMKLPAASVSELLTMRLSPGKLRSGVVEIDEVEELVLLNRSAHADARRCRRCPES